MSGFKVSPAGRGGGAEKPRSGKGRLGIRLLATGCAVFLGISAVWYITAYRPYEQYMEACRDFPDWREYDAFSGAGSDGQDYSVNVKRPGFLSWTGNLGVSMPPVKLRNGEEIWYTDALILWPARDGWELGVILFEYDFQGTGVSCTAHQLYIDREGQYLPWGDAAEDAANGALLESRREHVRQLLSRAEAIWGIGGSA